MKGSTYIEVSLYEACLTKGSLSSRLYPKVPTAKLERERAVGMTAAVGPLRSCSLLAEIAARYVGLSPGELRVGNLVEEIGTSATPGGE